MTELSLARSKLAKYLGYASSFNSLAAQ